MIRILTFISIITLMMPLNSLASHGMGGEITWECLGNGQYKFRFVFYRDCNGIPAVPNIDLTTTVPGIPLIGLIRIEQTDISFDGNQVTGQPCITCNTPGGVAGLVQKNVYESAPITLNGIPPPWGWQFYWGECCRTVSLSNTTGSGSLGFRSKAVMYSYNGQNASPCFDSSPFFAEKPLIGFCTGLPQNFTLFAYDNDGDHIVYTWAHPENDQGDPIVYTSGYNVNSQLPGPFHNPMNVAATLDSTTGMVSYLGFTGGVFNTNVKATAYKCGIKVSETYREQDITINNNCPLIMSTFQNTSPTIYPPFLNPVTQLFTEYIDTVQAGGFVSFQISVFDTISFLNFGGQSMRTEASGGTYGTNFTGQLQGGCEVPPCPQIVGGLPSASPVLQFEWQTSVDHYQLQTPGCFNTNGIYRFNLRTCDSYCPSNACETKTITIVLTSPTELKEPVLRCANVNSDGSVTLHWSPTVSIDSLGLFRSYKIYASNTSIGGFQLVDSVTSGINANTFTHSAAALLSQFSTTANSNDIFYKITTVSDYSGGEESGFSNRIGTMNLLVTSGPGHSAVLNWLAPSNPMLITHSSKYLIYREYPAGNWTLVDSTSNTSYSDLFPQTLCSDSVSYRVVLHDLTGCTMNSKTTKFKITSPTAGVIISPSNPVICLGQNSTTLTVNNAQSYLWSTLATTQSATVNATGTYTVTITQANGCTGQNSINVTASGNLNPSIFGPSYFCGQGNGTLTGGSGFVSYFWNTGETSQSINISVTSTAIYTVTVTHQNGCTASIADTVFVYPKPLPVISGGPILCQGQPIVLTCTPYSGYSWSTGANTQSITINSPGVYTVNVADSTGCQNDTSINIILIPTPELTISGYLSLCTGSTTLTATTGFSSYLWSNGSTNEIITVTTTGTYSITVTDINGCTFTESVVVTASASPVLQSNYSVCSGSSIDLNPGSFISYLWNTGETTQTINVNSAGTYTVSVTALGGCTGQASTTVSISTVPNPTITGGTSICMGENITLVASSHQSYLWNTGATTAFLFNISPFSTTTYTVTVTDQNGCTASASNTVVVNPKPNPVITGNTVICNGQTTILNAGPGYSTYSWNTGASTQTITVGVTGTFTVTVSDANGCAGDTSHIVNVSPNPAPLITGNLILCPGGSTNLNAGAGASSYFWSTGATSQVINVSTPGTYSVTVSNNYACIGSNSVIVTQNAAPALFPNYGFCTGSSVTLNPGGGFTTYLWNTGATTATINVNVAGTYTVSTTDTAGCTGVATTTVVENPNPTIILNGISFCQGGIANLDAGPMWTTYLWNTGAATQTIQVSNSGIYTITVTDINGCSGSDSALVTVYSTPPAIATAMGNTSFCIGDSLLLNATSGYPGYLWYRHMNPIQPNITQQSMYVKGMGSYYCRVTDGNGCSNYSNAIFIPAPCIPIGDPIEKSVEESNTFYCDVYPNPSNGNFTVVTNIPKQNQLDARITDVSGREVSFNFTEISETEFTISNLRSGIYILEIQNQRKRIVITE